MRENAYSPLFIVAFNGETERDDVSALYRAGVEGGYRKVRGCYKGVTERSWLLNAEQFSKVRDSGELANQESVLFLDNQRNGWLYFAKDGFAHGFNTVLLGEWKEVHATQAAKLEAWTEIDGKYFACR